MIQPQHYHFSIEEYECLAKSLWHEDERVELLDGEIYAMTPIGPEHIYSVTRFTKQLILQLGERAVVMSQSPLHLPPDGEPEPDIVLLEPPEEQYKSRLPRGEDVLLLIEVSKSTLEYDRTKNSLSTPEQGFPKCGFITL